MTDAEMIQKAAIAEAKRMIRQPKLRSFINPEFPDNTYTLEMELDEQDNWLAVTTWGYCYEGLYLPQSRQELVRNRIKAQLGWTGAIPKDIALRFYLDIQRRVDRMAA